MRVTTVLEPSYFICRVEGSLFKGRSNAPDKKRSVVVMTATISPPAKAVERSDQQLRLSDYKETLKFYLQLKVDEIDRILFIENSNSDLSSLVDLAKNIQHDKLVEFIGFQGNDHPANLGKAYGEFRLLDFGFHHSTIIDGEDDTFWKTTGRLRILNLETLVKSAPPKYDVICDLRKIQFSGAFRFVRKPWMDLRVYSCSMRGYRNLFYARYNKSEAYFDSRYLYHLVKSAPAHLKVFPRLARQPHLDGYSGRRNTQYNMGAQKYRHNIRDIVRRLIPGLWI